MRTKNTGTVLFLILALITAFFSCADIVSDGIDPLEVVRGNYAPGQKMTGINIVSFPYKMAYEAGEGANWSGLEIMEIYSDGSSAIYNYYNYEISGFDSKTPGEKTITISKNGYSATFSVFVNFPKGSGDLVSLSIFSPPQKQEYEARENADWTGLMVEETYSDGSSRVETNYGNYEISGFDSLHSGSQTITVSRNGVWTMFNITVKSSTGSEEEAALVSLSISSPPDKLVYEQGESADWTGLVVTGTYSDGTSAAITDYEMSGFDSSSPGIQTVRVSKSNNGYYYDEFIVTVEGLTSLSISSEPDKRVYDLNESPDWTGLVVEGHYVVKGSQIETIDYAGEISGFDSSGPGIKTITVVKKGVSVSFTVEVLPKGTGAITIVPPSQAADITLTLTGTAAVTVTASSGYTGYQWFVDGMARPGDSDTDGRSLTLNTPAYSAGKHRVRVTAHQQGLPYSGETDITITP